MKKKFKVTFIKAHAYEIEAETKDEAIEIAYDLDADKDEDIAWFLEPVDKIKVEEMI